MPANLAGTKGNEKFVARGQRVDTWHQLGTYVGDEPMNVEQAYQFAHIAEIVVDKWPLMMMPPQELRALAAFADAKPAVSNQVQLVRRPIDGDPTWRRFGDPVSANYGVLQPSDLARILQPLADKFNGVDTAGALGYGETIFTCFKAGEGHLPGFERENMVHYFIVVDYKDGRKAAYAMYAPVRVVCANTLMAATYSAAFSLKMPHRESLHTDLEWTTDFMLSAQSAQEKTLALFGQLASRHVTIDEMREVIAAAYPLPEKPRKVQIVEASGNEMTKDTVKELMARWQRETERVERDRAATLELAQAEGDTSAIGDSAYAVFNAVAEREQFTISGNADPLIVAKNAVVGSGAQAQNRALKAAVALLEK